MQKPTKCAIGLGIVAAGVIGAIALKSAGGVGSGGDVAAAPVTRDAESTVRSRALSVGKCNDGFASHELEHITRSSDAPARLFDSNGSGVAADDLDGDGLADIVLGNLEGPNTILWNEGNFNFSRQEMSDRSTRAVNLVDVDADDLLDIVTTHRGAGVAVWRNLGDRQFEQLALSGVSAAAYSMAWGDIDGDGDLDLATGSYDAELDQRLRSTFLFGDGAGVYVYRHDADGYDGERLATESQALATSLIDLDLDGRLDLHIGNDFALHDMTWSNTPTGFVATEPFERTTAHTMSVDAGDVDNDGIEEIFATDMKPASTSVDVLAEWVPLLATMEELDDPSDIQRVRNVLQISRGDGTFSEAADRAGVDTSGWSWSGRFGDLDNDGDNDIYVVNGMIAAETFWYLADAEIVEPNIAYSNHGDGTFGVADEWGLDSTASGRGSVIVDLDNDGRLDVVVNNLDSPSVAFENRLCKGDSFEFDLHQPGTANTNAIGATIVVETSSGRLVREVRSGGGYLSGSPTRLHFGLGEDTAIESAVIRWPDGSTTTVEAPRPGRLYEVTRQETSDQ